MSCWNILGSKIFIEVIKWFGSACSDIAVADNKSKVINELELAFEDLNRIVTKWSELMDEHSDEPDHFMLDILHSTLELFKKRNAIILDVTDRIYREKLGNKRTRYALYNAQIEIILSSLRELDILRYKIKLDGLQMAILLEFISEAEKILVTEMMERNPMFEKLTALRAKRSAADREEQKPREENRVPENREGERESLLGKISD